MTSLFLYFQPFAERSKAYFLNSIPDKLVKDLAHCDLDHLLNVNNHYAILPYKWVLRKAGLGIDTKEVRYCSEIHIYIPDGAVKRKPKQIIASMKV